jgi:ATP-dependent RNA helicase DHX8/PRP22
VALLSVESIFYCPYDKRDEAAIAKKSFIHYEGDHLTLLRLFQKYKSVKGDKQWCHNHFINYRSMKHVMDVYQQLWGFLGHQRHDDPTTETDDVLVRKCILAGFFHHTAVLQGDGTYQTLLTKQVKEKCSSCWMMRREKKHS